MRKLYCQVGFFFLISLIIISLTGCNLFLQIMEGINKDGGEESEDTKKLNPLPDSTEDGAIVIDSGFSDSNALVHYGMSYSNYFGEHLYLSSLYHKSITRIDLSTNSVSEGFPLILSEVNDLHGLAIDPDYGNIWLCDLNNHYLRHYDYNVDNIDNIYLGDTSQPVNVIALYDGYVYVADRANNSIWKVNIYEPQGSQVPYTDISDFSSSGYSDYIDMDFYEGLLCIVSQSLSGIVLVNTSDLSYYDTLSLSLSGTPIPHLGAVGICVSEYDGSIYLNANDHIYITDGFSGNIRSDWPIIKPDGYYGDYVEIELVNNTIYIASWEGEGSDIGAHILAYPAPPKPTSPPS